MATSGTSPLTENPIRMAMPFAGREDATRNDIYYSQPAGSATAPTLNAGFPSAYSSHGTYVTRGQMNGIGYLATANVVRAKNGGINTYNPKYVEMLKNGGTTGGYALDAILDWWDERNQVLCKVISLKANNDFDFTQRGDDGYSIGPDGVNWKICSNTNMWMPDYSHETGLIAGSNTIDLALSTTMDYVTGQFTMPFDGFVSIGIDATYTIPCSLFANLDASTLRFYLSNSTVTRASASATTANMAIFNFHKDVSAYFYGVLTGDVYDKCRHSIYLAMSDNGEDVAVDITNPIDGNSSSTLIHVSSSGTEGGGGCALIPAKVGTKMRLVGYQTYTEAMADTSLYVADTYLGKYWQQVMTANNLATVGSITARAKVVAYPAIG